MNTLRLAADRDHWSSYQDEALPQQPKLANLRRAWDRSAREGAPRSGLRPGSHVLRDHELQEHRERSEVLLVDGADTLLHATRAFSERDHVLVLADATGVVTHTAGGGDFRDLARRLHLVPGAAWSERERGTNAIGTVLAEGRAVTVEGAAHWGRRYHDLVCYAAPVVGPDGTVVGVLDATSSLHNADPALAGTVAAAARALELVLQAQAWAGAGIAARRVVESLLDRLPGVGMVVEPGGRVVRANVTGRVWMGSQPLPLPTSEVLGLSWRQLVREALHPTATLESRDRSRPKLQLRVEPLLDAAGGVLAVAVYGEGAMTRMPLPRQSVPPVEVEADPFERVFAEDAAVRQAVGFARKVAGADLTVTLIGESGSGREMLARAIHAASARASGRFVVADCKSLSDGAWVQADTGTLFLDEVADLAPRVQAALLRLLERGASSWVGGDSREPSDVRVICATSRDLPQLVEQGAFREDLYFLLKSVTITLPPLRARTDKLALSRHLLGPQSPPLADDLTRWIERFPWPGNVRELKSVLQMVQLQGADAPALDCTHLPPDLDRSSTPVPAAPVGPLATVEAWAVRRAVEEAGGNVSKAARSLGIARSTVYRIMRRDRASGSVGQSGGSSAS